MPRPAVPLPKDVIEIAKGLKAEGITSGVIHCADGTEIEWGDYQSGDSPYDRAQKAEGQTQCDVLRVSPEKFIR